VLTGQYVYIYIYIYFFTISLFISWAVAGEISLITGDTTNLVLNENWKQFWTELKPTFEETYGETCLQLSKVVFRKIPENDIFLD
jgi:hypothetical protein